MNRSELESIARAMVSQFGMSDAVGLVDGLYPGAAAQGVPASDLEVLATSGSAWLVVACDLPFLSEATLRHQDFP